MISHKPGNDLARLKRNYQAYKPAIAIVSGKMFWISVAITISFILSQAYLMLTQ